MYKNYNIFSLKIMSVVALIRFAAFVLFSNKLMISFLSSHCRFYILMLIMKITCSFFILYFCFSPFDLGTKFQSSFGPVFLVVCKS